MKRIFIAFLCFSSSLYGEIIGTYYGQTLVKPFGYMSPRPPTNAHQVDLGDIKIQFSARQVCGYTDWSTAVIGLPKQILSGQYWNDVGNQIKRKAIDSVLAISGALPSMLACSASPTFCAVLNRAEALAQANLKFTFDSCQMLEGMSDTTKAHFGPLASCVKAQVAEGKNQSQALDICSVGDRDPDSVKSKNKIKSAESGVKDPYKSEKLTDRLCQERQSARYRSSKHAYTVGEFSCNWIKSFLPGISVEASAKFRHGGTFSNSPAEATYDDTMRKASDFILVLLDLMHDIRYGKGEFSSQGPKPRHLVITHERVKRLLGQRPDGKLVGICYENDGSNCEHDVSKLPRIYKFSSGGALPALLISPATLYEIIEIVPKESKPSTEYAQEMSRLAVAIEPLVRSVAYSTTQDVLKDSLARLHRTCRDPDFQSQPAQEDCTSRIENLRQEQDNLKTRNESDREHLLAQVQFYSEVAKLKGSQFKVDPSQTKKSFSEFTNPQETR